MYIYERDQVDQLVEEVQSLRAYELQLALGNAKLSETVKLPLLLNSTAAPTALNNCQYSCVLIILILATNRSRLFGPWVGSCN